MKVIGKGRYARETYPNGTPPNFGIPNEIVRYYFRIDSSTAAGATYSPRPWTADDSSLVATFPPPLGPPPDFNFILPVPPATLDRAALSVVTINDSGAITGDPILVQWRGILGANPVIAVPAPALGAQQTLIETATLGALTSGTITVLNYDFSDVVVPLGGATIFPDLTMPANLVVPEGSSFECFLAVGIDYNAALINDPFGPPI